MDEILQIEAGKISDQYKISTEEALKKLQLLYSKDLKLQKRISGVDNTNEILRYREFKEFIKKARKDIYYDLRKFHTDAHSEQLILDRLKKLVSDGKWEETKDIFYDLAMTHASTKEREPYIKEFNEQLVMIAESAGTIFDVGGGLFPLRFPFKKFNRLTDYIWQDKDRRAFEILKLFSQTLPEINIALHQEPIGNYSWPTYLPDGKDEFDLVLMIKLVPLIYRQERPFIRHLSEIPAKRILITGSKESLTKKKSIYHRENEVLKEFIKLSGRRIVNKLEIPNEFGYLLE